MLDKDNPVQGFAVYLEVAKPDSVQQVFLIPKGYDSMGRLCDERYFYREVNVAFKKSLWRMANLPKAPTVSSSNPDEDVYTRLAVLLDWLGVSREDSGYSLVGKPLVVEVSRLDFDDIINNKTPTKLIYRINQSRIGAGFPVEVA